MYKQYTSIMSLTLNPATEQRIQRELARGRYASPDELLADALDLVNEREDWLLRNKDAINQRLDESFAASDRGESYSAEEVRDPQKTPLRTSFQSCVNYRLLAPALDDHDRIDAWISETLESPPLPERNLNFSKCSSSRLHADEW